MYSPFHHPGLSAAAVCIDSGSALLQALGPGAGRGGAGRRRLGLPKPPSRGTLFKFCGAAAELLPSQAAASVPPASGVSWSEAQSWATLLAGWLGQRDEDPVWLLWQQQRNSL